MNDRTPTEVLPNGAIRYEIYDETGQFLRYDYIKPGDEPTQEGTPLNKANLLKDDTAALYGLGADAVPDEVFLRAHSKFGDCLLRDMNIMLNLSLGTSNIDAWADLLDNTSRINTSKSSGYVLKSGVIKREIGGTISQTKYNDYAEMGYNTSLKKVAQTFVASENGTLSKVALQVWKSGYPTDTVRVGLYTVSSGKPSSLLGYSSEKSIGSLATVTFDIPNIKVKKGTTYAFTFERTGALSKSNLYRIRLQNTSVYSSGNALILGSVWEAYPDKDLYFAITIDGATQATIEWNATTAAEAFVKMAVAAEQTVGTGTITFFVSDDGTNWTQITALNAAQTVNFDATSVYLKAVITGNTTLSSVAWGGY